MFSMAHTDDVAYRAFDVARGSAQQESVIENLASACGRRHRDSETSADIEIAKHPKPCGWSTVGDGPSPTTWFAGENVIELMHASPCSLRSKEAETSADNGPSPAAWCADRDGYHEAALRLAMNGARGDIFVQLFCCGVACVLWVSARYVGRRLELMMPRCTGPFVEITISMVTLLVLVSCALARNI
eukprot:COSAG02_NODE_15312_length_1182_cov_1.286242_1_plen_186_part_10